MLARLLPDQLLPGSEGSSNVYQDSRVGRGAGAGVSLRVRFNCGEPPADGICIYATCHYRDSSRQEEADAIVAKLNQPISTAAVADVTILS